MGSSRNQQILEQFGDSLHLGPKPDETIEVQCRFSIFNISNVDTKANAATIRLELTLWWKDDRMKGWTGPLPGNLWGPKLRLDAGCPDMSESQLCFEHLFSRMPNECEDGTMKRNIWYHGPIHNRMSLQGFPFDVDILDIWFRGFCQYCLKDSFELTGQ